MFDESFSINEAMFVEREKFRFDFKMLRSVYTKKRVNIDCSRRTYDPHDYIKIFSKIILQRDMSWDRKNYHYECCIEFLKNHGSK